MNGGISRIVLSVAGFLLLGWLVHLGGTEAIRAAVENVHPGWLPAYLLSFALVAFLVALRWNFLVRALGAEISLRSLVAIWFAGISVGSVTTGAKLGGDPLRAYLLAQRGIGAGPAVASVVVDRGIELVANLVFAVAYCVLFATRNQTTAERILLVVVLGAVAFGALVLWVVRRLKRGDSLIPPRFAQVLARVGSTQEAVVATEDALRSLLFDHRARVWRAVATAFLLNVVIFVEFALAFRVFGATLNLGELAGAIMGVGLAHSLPIPGSVGALEGAQVAVFGLAGSGAHLALVAAVVVRIRDLVRAVPGALLLAFGGLRFR